MWKSRGSIRQNVGSRTWYLSLLALEREKVYNYKNSLGMLLELGVWHETRACSEMGNGKLHLPVNRSHNIDTDIKN